MRKIKEPWIRVHLINGNTADGTFIYREKESFDMIL
jgi:hypothetical protein